MIATSSDALPLPLRKLEQWLSSMRIESDVSGVVSGYIGPVVHWWRDSVRYCGVGFDWRYEGIIQGYLALFKRTGDLPWLEKACQAGTDLVQAQLTGGNYPWSGFEQNPSTGGTPHEAAADIGLLALSGVLRERGDARWQTYLHTARRNIQDFYVARLWDTDSRVFRDAAGVPSFVPNKAATLVEALFRLADLTGDDQWIKVYARPTLDEILRHQALRPGHSLAGC